MLEYRGQSSLRATGRRETPVLPNGLWRSNPGVTAATLRSLDCFVASLLATTVRVANTEVFQCWKLTPSTWAPYWPARPRRCEARAIAGWRPRPRPAPPTRGPWGG